MNIQFHYFVIRFITKRLGFDDATSQLIATVSQFVDDSDDASDAAAVSFIKADIEGTKVEQRGLYSPDGANVKVYIPRTIQHSYADFPPPDTFDYTDITNICWQSMIPFHYPPLDWLDYTSEECLCYQVTAPDSYDTRGIFRDATDYACGQYQGLSSGSAGCDTREETLIRIGVIAHMLADAYAHMNVNGLVCLPINDTTAWQVIEKDSPKNLTAQYTLSPAEQGSAPYVGQYRMKTVLDDCHLHTNFVQNSLVPQKMTIVDNLDQALGAALAIYDFFMALLKITDDRHSVWQGTYLPVIEQMLSFRESNFATIAAKWQAVCPDIAFAYDKAAVIKTLKDAKKPNYLFGAAVVADDMRIAVRKPAKLRRMHMDNDVNGPGSVSFSAVNFEGTNYTVTATGITAEDDKPKMLSIITYDVNNRQEDSHFFPGSADEGNSITGAITNKIPLNKTLYTFKSALYTQKKGSAIPASSASLPVDFVDTHTLITCSGNNLNDIDSDNVNVYYNIQDVPDGSISIPDNADYFDQNNDHFIDIYLPLSAQFTLDRNYTLTSVVPTACITDCNDGNTVFLHCGNPLKNVVEIADDKSSCSVTFDTDWKNRLSLQKYALKTARFSVSVSLLVSVEVKDIPQKSGDGPQFTGNRTFLWQSANSAFPKLTMRWQTSARKR